MTIGENIRRIRKEKGISQKELAQQLGVSAQNLFQYEKNMRNPKPKTLKRIADALEVATTELEDEDKRFEYTWTSGKAKKSFYNQLKALVKEKCNEINHLVSGCNSPFTYLQVADVQESLNKICEALGIKDEE